MRRYHSVIIRIITIILLHAFCLGQTGLAVPYTKTSKLRSLELFERGLESSAAGIGEVEAALKGPAAIQPAANTAAEYGDDISKNDPFEWARKKARESRDIDTIQAVINGLMPYRQRAGAVILELQQMICNIFIGRILSDNELSEGLESEISLWLQKSKCDVYEFLKLLLPVINDVKYTSALEVLIEKLFNINNSINKKKEPWELMVNSLFSENGSIDFEKVEELRSLLRGKKRSDALDAAALRLNAMHKNIALVGLIEAGNLATVRRAITMWPLDLTTRFVGGEDNVVRLDLAAVFERSGLMGVSPTMTIGTVKISQQAAARRNFSIEQLIWHELIHKVTLSSGKDGKPIVSVKFWKDIAKQAGFAGYIKKEETVGGSYEYRFVAIDEIDDDMDYKELRVIPYGSWVFQEADGRWIIYATDKDIYYLEGGVSRDPDKDETTMSGMFFDLLLARGISRNVNGVASVMRNIRRQKNIPEEDYRKKMPEEFVAELAAVYIDNKDTAVSQAGEDMIYLLEGILFNESDVHSRMRALRHSRSAAVAAPAAGGMKGAADANAAVSEAGSAGMAGPSTMLGAGKVQANAAAEAETVGSKNISNDEIASRLENFDGIKLYAVHVSRFKPQRNELGQYIIKTTLSSASRAELALEYSRAMSKVHFTLNGVLSGQLMSSSWADADNIIIVPLADLVRANPGMTVGGSTVDFMLFGNVVLPEEAVISHADSLFDILYARQKAEAVITKDSELRYVDAWPWQGEDFALLLRNLGLYYGSATTYWLEENFERRLTGAVIEDLAHEAKDEGEDFASYLDKELEQRWSSIDEEIRNDKNQRKLFEAYKALFIKRIVEPINEADVKKAETEQEKLDERKELYKYLTYYNQEIGLSGLLRRRNQFLESLERAKSIFATNEIEEARGTNKKAFEAAKERIWKVICDEMQKEMGFQKKVYYEENTAMLDEIRQDWPDLAEWQKFKSEIDNIYYGQEQVIGEMVGEERDEVVCIVYDTDAASKRLKGAVNALVEEEGYKTDNIEYLPVPEEVASPTATLTEITNFAREIKNKAKKVRVVLCIETNDTLQKALFENLRGIETLEDVTNITDHKELRTVLRSV